MKTAIHNPSAHHAGQLASGLLLAVAFAGMMAMPGLAFAEDSFGDAEEKVTGFFDSLNALLNVASIAVVTIAVIFAGYQIAFAHKRISDVAPVLIGGFLIGAAAQLAKMLMGDNSELATLNVVLQQLPLLYA